MSHTYPQNSENPPGRPKASEKFQFVPEGEFGNIARALNVVARVPVVGIPAAYVMGIQLRVALYIVALPVCAVIGGLNGTYKHRKRYS